MTHLAVHLVQSVVNHFFSLYLYGGNVRVSIVNWLIAESPAQIFQYCRLAGAATADHRVVLLVELDLDSAHEFRV